VQAIFDVGPGGNLVVFGIPLIGANAETGRKLLISVIAVLVVMAAKRLLRMAVSAALRGRTDVRARFWTRQGVQLITTFFLVILLVSIWFDAPERLATPAGLLTAGLAVALQRVVLAVAGYFVILSGRVFNVGDRIAMSGVRGDVIALGYTRTTIMEMGQPPPVQDDDPAVWVGARQFTGRVVTETNDKIFDEPVYNYTRDFPYIWEEIRLAIRYGDDRKRAEAILLEAVRRHATPAEEIRRSALANMRRRYNVQLADLEPRVYLRLEDSWVELAARFVVPEHGIRDIKDAITREVLDRMDEAGIPIATAVLEVTTVSPLRIRHAPDAG